jgi:hypothetical protein
MIIVIIVILIIIIAIIIMTNKIMMRMMIARKLITNNTNSRSHLLLVSWGCPGRGGAWRHVGMGFGCGRAGRRRRSCLRGLFLLLFAMVPLDCAAIDTHIIIVIVIEGLSRGSNVACIAAMWQGHHGVHAEPRHVVSRRQVPLGV